ncbi:hypothetical protein OPV22_024034 [Ensete ventricosum]|uniref:Uncharacterized protein n=1 Tax=Ensete ventricosum TaxID=4639 RepID=A0AAV8QWY7_ENSVE|nr:hypothetical protein OPV22_024034 [Ensete ventricosum]
MRARVVVAAGTHGGGEDPVTLPHATVARSVCSPLFAAGQDMNVSHNYREEGRVRRFVFPLCFATLDVALLCG